MGTKLGNQVILNEEHQNDLFNCILEHNERALLSELSLIKTSINLGTLRQLVESRMATGPIIGSILRVLDLNYYTELEKYFPIEFRGPYQCISREGLNRVEVLRFRARVINRYKKPEYAKILILLPCSAKKPYSSSKSHKLFSGAIQKAVVENTKQNICTNLIHPVIVTSPLGLVPAELELVTLVFSEPPAAFSPKGSSGVVQAESVLHVEVDPDTDVSLSKTNRAAERCKVVS